MRLASHIYQVLLLELPHHHLTIDCATLGFIGLNNLKRTDYISVVVHALAHIPPLRDFFLLSSNTDFTHKSPLLLRFGELLRKIWSPYNIKNTVFGRKRLTSRF